MNFQRLKIEKTESIITVRLNRPEIHNAFDPVLIDELKTCFEQISQDQSIRVVVLTGNGKSFCAGADLNWMKSTVRYTFEQNRQDANNMAHMFDTLNRCPKPVIGRINGTVLGGGMGLVSICDVAIAVERAQFGFSETKLGLVPAVISPFVLAKIGPSQARALFTTGERFSATRAKEIGLIHEVVSENNLDPAIKAKILEYLSAAPKATTAAKSLVIEQTQPQLSTLLHINAELIARLRANAEGQEGMAAFLDKRKPGWCLAA